MKIQRRALFLLPLSFLGLFFFYPLATIFAKSFAPKGFLDLAPLLELARDDYYARVLWFTIWQAGVSTLLTLMAALPASYAFARFRFPGRIKTKPRPA